MPKQAVLALYGTVAIERGYCSHCQTHAFIRAGKFACCDAPTEQEPTRFQRIVSPEPSKRRPKRADQERILTEQEHACIYCGAIFGDMGTRNGYPVKIKLNWDHQIPWAYSQNNRGDNFVAACHVCNGLKADHIFRDLDDARAHLAPARQRKGYNW